MPSAVTDEITRALGWLNQSPIRLNDNALYQAIRALIGNESVINTTVVGQTASILSDYITFVNNTSSLPNSRVLTAGFGITIDLTTPGQVIISSNASQAVSFAKTFMMGA